MPMIEIAYLEELAPDHLYEFAFADASLKWRGATARARRGRT